MDFADTVRKSAELVGQHQEVTAIELLQMCHNNLVPRPDNWDELFPEVRAAILKFAKEIK
jgi:hypothetical protein